MKKKTKRKYRSLTHPVEVAIERAALITTKRNNEYRNKELAAINRMARGPFDDDTWHVVLYVANQAELMGYGGVGHEVIEPARRAQIALARMRARRTPDGVWRAEPGEVFDLRELQEYHDLQRQSVPYGQYLEFVRRTLNKMRTGSLPNHEKILENQHEQQT